MSDKPESALKRIAEVKETKGKSLDLSGKSLGQPLGKIPPEVFELTWLEQLNLGRNDLTEIPPSIKNLQSLRQLNLERNKLVRLPDDLLELQTLEDLSLILNSLEQVPDEIGQLKSLTTLRLWGNHSRQVALPRSISRLTNLETLDVIRFTLKVIPDWITELPKLNDLDLARNDISAIPEWFGELRMVKNLWLYGNRLSNLPNRVSWPSGLRLLSLSSNAIQTFPTCILEADNLRYLWLDDNQLPDLPDSIAQLRHLDTLGLENNRLTVLPDAIYRLANLRRLELANSADAQGNQIPRLSVRFLGLERLQYITLQNNPIVTPPPEIVERGVEAIREYFRQLEAQGTDQLYEAKLLVLGEGGAGKTTLVKKLLDPEYKLREEDSTRGIDVARWDFPVDDDRTFRVNMWDFGGQEIYHATHQFFLTKRSLYLLVTDDRKEDTDFYYWLNLIALLSENSPVLIVKNEKKDRERQLPEGELRSQFPNLRETIATNFANNRGLDHLGSEIRHYLTQLPHVGTPLPKTWIRVREALEHHTQNHISLEEYFEVCEQAEFRDIGDKLQLSGYLHDLGVCLHFQDDPILKKTVILRPKWGTDAVYKVLDNERVRRDLGRFTRTDLASIWNESQYAGMQDELLQLMVKFKLCYQLPGELNTYIAPQLLRADPLEYEWVKNDNLLLRYSYEFMPRGILTQFIVVMNEHIAEHRLVWKTGVVLDKDKSKAEIIEYYGRREIRVRVAGEHKKDLLTIVMYELDKIHGSYPQLKYNKLVPCNCTACKEAGEPHFFEFEILRHYVEGKQPRIQCPKKFEFVDIWKLVDEAVGREQLVQKDLQMIEALDKIKQSMIVVQGSVGQLVVGAEDVGTVAQTIAGQTLSMPKHANTVKSAWANGSFYLFSFVIVVGILGALAKVVPWYSLSLVLIASVIFVPVVGALQLKMDDRLPDKSFIELMRIVIGQLPLLGRVASQSPSGKTP